MPESFNSASALRFASYMLPSSNRFFEFSSPSFKTSLYFSSACDIPSASDALFSTYTIYPLSNADCISDMFFIPDVGISAYVPSKNKLMSVISSRTDMSSPRISALSFSVRKASSAALFAAAALCRSDLTSLSANVRSVLS